AQRNTVARRRAGDRRDDLRIGLRRRRGEAPATAAHRDRQAGPVERNARGAAAGRAAQVEGVERQQREVARGGSGGPCTSGDGERGDHGGTHATSLREDRPKSSALWRSRLDRSIRRVERWTPA